MSLKIFDFECPKCGTVEEHMVSYGDIVYCEPCKCIMKKVFSGTARKPDTAGWITSVLEVVDKDSPKPHVREFLKNPTRDNYKRWMKGEGLRHLEEGERSRPKEAPDINKITHEILSKAQERRRIELYR